MTQKELIKQRKAALLDYLRVCFKPNNYITIEELCENIVVYDTVTMEDGRVIIKDTIHPYKLNTNPYTHDKCVLLGQDIKAINWDRENGQHEIIIRDSQGSVKLCESLQEFNEWRDKEMKPLIRKYQFLSTLKAKANEDGSCPVFDFKDGEPVENEETISAFHKGE